MILAAGYFCRKQNILLWFLDADVNKDEFSASGDSYLKVET